MLSVQVKASQQNLLIYASCKVILIRKQISYSDFSSIKIPYPPIKEQKKIANVLNYQKKEIDLLKQDLEQEKQKKKALMQLLLTGIVRVK